MILGVIWLETLRKVVMDWSEMSMVFSRGGKEVKLRGHDGSRKKGRESIDHGIIEHSGGGKHACGRIIVANRGGE